MVFNATFNNIPAITWQSVLLVEETGVPGEILQPTITNFQKEKKNRKKYRTSQWPGSKLYIKYRNNIKLFLSPTGK
jgi:hypothetical protein